MHACKVTSVMSDFCDPMDCSPPGPSVHGILQERILQRLSCPLSGDLPDPGIELMSLMSAALAGGFFIASALGEFPLYAISTAKHLYA